MENNNGNGRETIATFTTVRWQWMAGDLVDGDERTYEIFRKRGQIFVRKRDQEEPLGRFLAADAIGRRIHYVFRASRMQRLEALDGATLDLYPYGSARWGLKSIAIEGGELDGAQF